MRLIDGWMVWKHKATHGVPLDFLFQILAKHGAAPTWDHLFESARKDGANIERLTNDCCFFVKEAYEPDDAEQIIKRLREGRHLRGVYGTTGTSL